MAGELSVDVSDSLLSIVTTSFYAGCALFIAYRLSYFTYTWKIANPLPDLKDCFRVFGVFLVAQLFIIPLFIYGSLILGNPDLKLNTEWMGWVNLIGIFGIMMILSGFFLLDRKKLSRLFYSKTPYFDIGLGMMSWLIAFPSAMALSQIMTYVLTDLFGYTLQDQLAVTQVKQSLEYPFLFSMNLVAVVFIVPILEELMFRGYLQSAIRPLVGAKKAIVFSAALFSIFHFAFNQGVNNFNILGALFILALFLGFLRERQGNLLASIALHSSFNAISVLMIML